MIPLTQVVDHTLLKADATPEQIRTLCDEAKQFKFFSVCVNPTHIALAKHELKGTEVKVATVVGFPLGANTTATKVFEAKTAIELGADELDMVINIGAAKAHEFAKVEADIRAVVDVCRPKIVKVIIETALLTDAEKVQACLAAKKAHANFVKTSTGFSTAGATLADIRLMRETVGPEMGIKASGGLKTLRDFEAMIDAGATRLGTSSAVQVLRGQTHPGGY